MSLRAYKDPDGAEWRVWRVVPDSSFSTLGESYRDGWLCFERFDGGDRRRLSMSQVPDAWDTLADDRLDALRRLAEPATRKWELAGKAADRPGEAGGRGKRG